VKLNIKTLSCTGASSATEETIFNHFIYFDLKLTSPLHHGTRMFSLVKLITQNKEKVIFVYHKPDKN
jgi:hypothetical protein